MRRANPAIMPPAPDDRASAGDPKFPEKYPVIEVHVCGLRELFNSVDPARHKDLDREAEFIAGRATDQAQDVPLSDYQD